MQKHVFVATPTYDGSLSKEFHNSMVAVHRLCWEAGISISERQIPHHPVDEARNVLLGWFLGTRATDIFYIDADCGFDPDGFMRILMSPKDFVGGAMRVKSDTEVFPAFLICNEQDKPWVDPSDGYILSGGLGGFFRVSRQAVDRMCEHYHSLCYEAMDGTICYDLFRREPRPGLTPYGEDLSFCRRWLKMGEKIWIDPDIDFVHIGRQGWDGNLHEALVRRPGGKLDSGKPLGSRIDLSKYQPMKTPTSPLGLRKPLVPINGQYIAERLRDGFYPEIKIGDWLTEETNEDPEMMDESENMKATRIDENTKRIVAAAREAKRMELVKIVNDLNEQMTAQEDSCGW